MILAQVPHIPICELLCDELTMHPYTISQSRCEIHFTQLENQDTAMCSYVDEYIAMCSLITTNYQEILIISSFNMNPRHSIIEDKTLATSMTHHVTVLLLSLKSLLFLYHVIYVDKDVATCF